MAPYQLKKTQKPSLQRGHMNTNIKYQRRTMGLVLSGILIMPGVTDCAESMCAGEGPTT